MQSALEILPPRTSPHLPAEARTAQRISLGGSALEDTLRLVYGFAHLMHLHLVDAIERDQSWLERLRRSVYEDLFVATFGGWDETRHRRHVEECWQRGHIFIIEVNGARVGMIQFIDNVNVIEINELQIAPDHQNQGIGSAVLKEMITRAHRNGRPVVLSVGLRNDRALRFYVRHGFRQVSETATHRTMINEPAEADLPT